ncbi:MAG: c-type cytochrome biogenesis protein CcmI, partial [Betaproteobacteria bacterium]
MNSAPAFWIIALVLVALTVAALVWPLLRPRDATRAVADDDASADVYRDQKRQLEADVAAGAITLDERNAGLDEIAARLGDELQPVAAGPAASPRASTFAAIALAAILPVAALVLYAALGRPDVMRTTAANTAAPRSEADIVAMVDKLAARMKEQPEDATGWKLLGRAYAAMGRYDASVGAFKQAAARSPDVDASLLADWADALAMKNQSLNGEPADLVMRALAREPTNAKALSLAAAAALERRDFDGAIAQWRTLAAQFPPESPEARDIAAMIADADAVRRRPVPSESAAVAAATGPGT